MAETQSYEKGAGPLKENPVELPPLEQTTKGRWERSWPTIACGAGLFSDGYLNQVRCVLSSVCAAPQLQCSTWVRSLANVYLTFTNNLGSRSLVLSVQC